MKKTAFTFAALILAMLTLTSCSGTDAAHGDAPSTSASSSTSTPSPSTSPSVTTVPRAAAIDGSPATMKEFGGSATATVTIHSATYGPTLPGDKLDTTPAAGGFLILNLEFDAIQGATTVNPMYVTATDVNGHAGPVALGTQGMLPLRTISAGEKARGNVGLDVSDAAPYTVTITDGGFQPAATFLVTPTAR